MGLQKFRADEAHEACPNGAIPFYTRWIGGPTLALIRNCPTPFGPRTVYIQDHPDTYFSQPAAIEFRRRRIKGYVTCTKGNWEFHAERVGPGTVYPSTDTEADDPK